MSLLYKAPRKKLQLILIDPKKVEFIRYRDIPNLMLPVVTSAKEAAGALAAAVEEMERRYEMFGEVGVTNLEQYNDIIKNDEEREPLHKIIIIIDELADLMFQARDYVEDQICRLLGKARAAGIHLIIATQRPSVDVITGLLKANLNARIALPVTSPQDSKCILDRGGAEKLSGKGDMIFVPNGSAYPLRVQGAYVSNDEVESVCRYLIQTNGTARYDETMMEEARVLSEKVGNKKKGGDTEAQAAQSSENFKDKSDEFIFKEACRLAVSEGRISTSLLQRKFGVGYGRAAKIIDKMEDAHYVSKSEGNQRPRSVLITPEEFQARFADDNDDSVQEEE